MNHKKMIIAAIIILVIMIVITVIGLIILLQKNDNTSNRENEYYVDPPEEEETIEDEKYNISENEYFILKSCVQLYLDSINKNNSDYYITEENGSHTFNEDSMIKAIYNILTSSYLNNNNINEKNVLKNVQLLDEKVRFYPIEIEMINLNPIATYKIKGVTQNLDNKNSTEKYFLLNTDSKNETFTIEEMDKDSYNTYKNTTEKLNSIESNNYNSYMINSITMERVATEYFEKYKFLTLAHPKYTYEKMTEEYKTKRFGTLQNYIQYIRDNKKELEETRAEKYLLNGTQYIIQDQYQNLYIFDANSLIDFNVKLDTYTIEEEKFAKEYDVAQNSKKVQMNIDKFFQMINRQDYKTSYEVLADSFKANNMKTEDEFKQIVKERFFTHNKVQYLKTEEVGSNTYACEIALTDLMNEDSELKKVTIIMQLLENRSFVMSFSME